MGFLFFLGQNSECKTLICIREIVAEWAKISNI